MSDSTDNSGKGKEETGPVHELQSESNYSANSFNSEFETSADEVMQHLKIDDGTSSRFARPAVASLEHRFDVKESISCQDGDDTRSRSMCSGNVPNEVFDHGESFIGGECLKHLAS